MVNYELRAHSVHGDCLWISDGQTELAVALEFGIRIVHLSAVGGENLLYVQPADDREYTTPEGWRLRGGHRFWLAPESQLSYCPDNGAVAYETMAGGVTLTQWPDPWLMVQKRLDVTFLEDGSIRVNHGAKNLANQARTCGLWGVTTLRGGGTARIPFASPQGLSVYAPNRAISLWGDTAMNDPRVRFGGDEVTVQHQMGCAAYFKMGFTICQGWAAFEAAGQRFTKQFGWQPHTEYPDNQCNFELYQGHSMMELESLGPLRNLAPGAEACHEERWQVEWIE